MRDFVTAIIKPTMDCNVQCKHCYHLPSERSREVMSAGTFENTVKLLKEGAERCRFIFHGGEPLMVPMSFYKNAISAEKKAFGKFICENTIQTNGTLLSRRFIEFCKNNRINLGISYEGGYENGLRPGMDSEKIDSLVKYMVDKEHMFLICSTVHGKNIDDVGRIYDKFTGMGATVTFNPIINMGCARENPEFALDPERYADVMIGLFDRWIRDVDVKVPVLPFFQYVVTSLNTIPNASDCPHSSCLMKWICVYPNGDVYPCGKACPAEYRLGNVNEVESLDELFESDGMRNILIGSIERRKKCKDCEIYRFCNGGCSVDAGAEGDIQTPGGASCVIYKKLFTHINDVVNGILKDKPDMSQYNGFVRDAVLGRLINPLVIDETLQ